MMNRTDYIEAKQYYQARKKVREIRMFYKHLTIFILMTIILWVINFMISPEYIWFIWCFLGGITGVIIHGLQAFGLSPILTIDWEERTIAKILEKESNRQKENNHETNF